VRGFIFCTLPQVLLGKSNKKMRWARNVACMGEERKGGDRDFVGKTKRKRPLED
jgi:hypothetical protein